MSEEEAKNVHENFVRRYLEIIHNVDTLIADCELCCDMSLLYDFFENRARRCDAQLTEDMGEDWWEHFNHYFTGD